MISGRSRLARTRCLFLFTLVLLLVSCRGTSDPFQKAILRGREDQAFTRGNRDEQIDELLESHGATHNPAVKNRF